MTLLVTLFAVVTVTQSIAQETHIVPGAPLVIDGVPDADLTEKTLAFELTMARIGAGIGPYIVYLSYDANNIYFACDAEDNNVSCKDAASADFKDSDYIRFYICVDDDFKGRQALNGDTDWAIIFTPLDTKDNWAPMVKEDPYNGPGHGAIEGDDITTERASSDNGKGWYVEAAIPLSLFEITMAELTKTTFGVYFIAGDTDGGGVRTGEVSLEGPGAGNYWQSPDYWQETELGEILAVDSSGKLASMWGGVKNNR